jgi:TonB family protein
MFLANRRAMTIAEGSRTWEGRLVEGKFPLRRFLGGSDHSAVFLTQRTGQDPQKATLKLMEIAGIDPERQLAEWRTAALLSHPHLVRIFEAGRCEIDGTPFLYLVTECAEEDLSQILPQRPLAPAEAGDMLLSLLGALSYLHSKDLVHGRIKPSNVQAVDDQLKLSADHVMPSGEGNIRRRDVYDAPETAAGIVSPAGDMWSVGVTLLAALTQDASFAKDSWGDPAVPSAVPEPFRGIVRECLHLDPKRRCTVSDIVARLQPAARSVPAEPETPTSHPRRGFSRGTAIALATIGAVLVLGLVLFFSRGRNETSQPPATPAQVSQQSAPEATPPSAPPPKPAAAPKPDSRGVAVHQVLPEVPQSARNTIKGKLRVIVQVEVDPTGKVTSARLTSPGPSRYFANLALKAAREWGFSPPTSNGQPVASAWTLGFRFGRTRTEVAPERLPR